MVDNYITFAWILKDVSDRSKKFILYALGQEKLEIEHRKEYEISKGRDPEKDPILQAKTAWIDSQRFHFLTDVDVGSWSGMSTREMAEQAGCADIYHFAYTPFSAAAHSMWNHVAKYNMTQCENPLHRMHRVPVDAELDMDPDYLYRSAKYVDKLFRAFDSAFGIKIEQKPSIQVLREIFDRFSEPTPESEGGQQSSESPPA
jgi:hypothetical protein